MNVDTRIVEFKCKPCPFCGKQSILELRADKIRDWQDWQHIQDAFPELTADQRELMLSGTDSDCWDKYMKLDDDEDDE